MGKVTRTVKGKAPWNDSGVMKMKASGRQLCPNIALFGFVFETLVGLKALHLRNRSTELSSFIPLEGSMDEDGVA